MSDATIAQAGTASDQPLTDSKAHGTWYLSASKRSDLKIDVETVWEDYSGDGIKVAVLDTQIDFRHGDLAKAYDANLDMDFVNGTSQVSPETFGKMHPHGTMVAGIIAAEGGNGIGSVGVAHQATLVGYALSYSSADVVAQAVAGLRAATSVDVINNSWSFSRNFEDHFGKSRYPEMADALVDLAETGRSGLGTSVVFAAGNAGTGGMSNYHNLQNSPTTIAVGAVDADGNPARFTSLGANVLISAPGVDVLTTNTNDRYTTVSGTSFAAPVVSGAIALMYEANDQLGYRDVQQILAYSARRAGLSDMANHGDGWRLTGADNHNGGGLHFHDGFGFGFLNVHDAVRLAETWTLQQTAANRASLTIEDDMSERLVAGQTDQLSFEFHVSDHIRVEHVQIALDFRGMDAADLDITLISPNGTAVRLVHDLPDGVTAGSLRNFALSSVATMGEDGRGVWRVEIVNRNTDATDRDGLPLTGLLEGFSATVHGATAGLGDDTYIFTDELALLYSGGAHGHRHVIHDLDGGVDTINASPVTTDSQVDLTGETATRIAGVTIRIENPASLENAFTGDGDDVLIGNLADNDLRGGRGDDVLHYSAGHDVLNGGAGTDTMWFTIPFTVVTTQLTQAGDLLLGVIETGLSMVRGIEIFRFADTTYSLSDLLNRLTQPAPEDEADDEGPTAPADPQTPPDQGSDEEPGTFDSVIIGSDAGGRLTGTQGADRIVGGARSDRLSGAAGDDLLEGGGGKDQLSGDAGDDRLIGGADNDRLNGGSGNDWLQGDSGADILFGGAGADSFVLDLRHSNKVDIIRDMDVAEGDMLVVTGLPDDLEFGDFRLVRTARAAYLEVDLDGDAVRLAKITGADMTHIPLQLDTDVFMFA